MAWALPREQLLSSLWSDFGDLLPGSLAASVSGTGDIGTTAAVLGSVVWIVGLTAMSMVVFQRRDVAGT